MSKQEILNFILATTTGVTLIALIMSFAGIIYGKGLSEALVSLVAVSFALSIVNLIS